MCPLLPEEDKHCIVLWLYKVDRKTKRGKEEKDDEMELARIQRLRVYYQGHVVTQFIGSN